MSINDGVSTQYPITPTSASAELATYFLNLRNYLNSLQMSLSLPLFDRTKDSVLVHSTDNADVEWRGDITFSCGRATMVGGVVTVLNTAITTNSLIFLTEFPNCSGLVQVTAKTVGASFVISSSDATDVGTVGYLLIPFP